MKIQKSTLIQVSIFLLSLLYFSRGTSWYEPSYLVIQGTAESTDSIIDIMWDSGAGFNDYERRHFEFQPTRSGEKESHQIIIRGDIQSGSFSKGRRVLLNEIRIDDRGVYIPSKACKKVRYIPRSGWLLYEDASEIELNLPIKEHISFSFKTDDKSGIARILINGNETRHNLYRKNWEIQFYHADFWMLDDDGNFSVSFVMPRYKIDSLCMTSSEDTRFSSVYLTNQKKRLNLPVDAQMGGKISLQDPLRNLKRYFHPLQFIFQFAFSALMTWLVWSAVQIALKLGSIKNIFYSESRWCFWLLWSGSVVVFSLWLLAFWPGVMSVDSLNIWRAAILPEILVKNHPLLNELWYMLMVHIWNNIAIVPIIQTAILSSLTAVVYFYCFRQGIQFRWLFPFYLFLVLSVPVGLYNITLWKDIPFALLVIIWALILPYYCLKKQREGRIRLSSSQTLFLLFLFFLLLLFRYNGIIYLFILPLFFSCLGLFRLSKIWVAVIVIGASGVLWFTLFPPKGMRGTSFFYDLSQSYLQKLSEQSIGEKTRSTLTQYLRLLDINKNKKESDFWHYYLSDRYAYSFLREVGWFDVYPYRAPDNHPFPRLRQIALKIYHKSLDYPWLYFTWYPFILLYLFPFSIILFRWLPLSAIFSAIIFSQTLALLIVTETTNWRYYYFVLLAGHFLLPMILMDIHLYRSKHLTATINNEASA